MDEDKRPILDKEDSKLFGALYFVVIVCPILIVVMMANNIQIPDPRIIFWLAAITGFAVFLAIVILDSFLYQVLSSKTLEAYKVFRKRYLKPFPYVEPVLPTRSQSKSIVVVTYIIIEIAYVLALRFVFFLTFGR